MARWEPDARGRLRAAAMALYVEHGFENTTVADIAERAGVTSRTFFRHFADRREVLFDGMDELLDKVVAAADATPGDAGPMAAVAAALDAAAGVFGGDRAHSRRRRAIIAANPELQERELRKMSTLAGAFTAALHRKDVAEPDASLATEAGIAVLRVAIDRWLADDERRDLATLLHDSLDRLETLVTAPRPESPSPS